jgi:hypothetical protein
VQVKIGFDFYAAGCIEYIFEIPKKDYKALMGKYVGASVGGAAAIIILIAAITRQKSTEEDL